MTFHICPPDLVHPITDKLNKPNTVHRTKSTEYFPCTFCLRVCVRAYADIITGVTSFARCRRAAHTQTHSTHATHDFNKNMPKMHF